MISGAIVLLDEEGANWWASNRQSQGSPVLPPAHTQVFCGSLKAWAVLEKRGADHQVHWLGGLGEEAWAESEERLRDWHRELAEVSSIPAQAALQEPIRELLSGDLGTPALMSLAQLPLWVEALAGLSPVFLPVGQQFRPPRFSHLGDVPLHVLGSVLAERGQAVKVLPVLSPTRSPSPSTEETEAWNGPVHSGAIWLTLGKLRHPEWPLIHLEALGLQVVLLEPEPAAALPDLFADATRWRCHPQLDEPSAPPPPPGAICPPEGGASAGAGAWLETLRHWPPLIQAGRTLGEERLRLDQLFARRLPQAMPALTLVPEENDLVIERLLTLLRREGRPHAVLHHTAEILPAGNPLRWQRHLQSSDRRLVPLRCARMEEGLQPLEQGGREVVSLDPVRAHLLDALELEVPLPWPEDSAVGWIHYPLLQQALLPLADPLAYWNAVDTVREGLAGWGTELLLARKPPLEPCGFSDALAQGLRGELPCKPLSTLLALSQVVIAPGHLGTAHLEAMARGRAVVMVSPARLRRPSLLLEDRTLPIPRLTPETFLPWWRCQTRTSLEELAKEQGEWLRQQVTTSVSLGGWLRDVGVPLETRPQRFLGSGLMVQRPLLERAEQVGRLAKRLHHLRNSPPAQWLRALLARRRRR